MVASKLGLSHVPEFMFICSRHVILIYESVVDVKQPRLYPLGFALRFLETIMAYYVQQIET